MSIKNRNNSGRKFRLDGEGEALRIDSATKDILRRLVEIVKASGKKPKEIAFLSMSRIADAAIKIYSMVLRGHWVLFDAGTCRPIHPNPSLDYFMVSREKLVQLQVVGAVALLRTRGYEVEIARTTEGVVTVSFGGEVVDSDEYAEAMDKAMSECVGPGELQ